MRPDAPPRHPRRIAALGLRLAIAPLVQRRLPGGRWTTRRQAWPWMLRDQPTRLTLDKPATAHHPKPFPVRTKHTVGIVTLAKRTTVQRQEALTEPTPRLRARLAASRARPHGFFPGGRPKAVSCSFKAVSNPLVRLGGNAPASVWRAVAP